MWPKSREVLRPSDGGLVRVAFEENCCLSDAKANSTDDLLTAAINDVTPLGDLDLHRHGRPPLSVWAQLRAA
jgi:hypothetical protein